MMDVEFDGKKMTKITKPQNDKKRLSKRSLDSLKY